MTPPTRGYQLLRNAALSLAVHHDATRPLINPRQSRPYTYADSPLSAFAARDREFDAGPVAGAPLINRQLNADRFLLDRLGVGFSGIYFCETGKLPPEVHNLFRELVVGNEAFEAIVIARHERGASLAAAAGTFAAYGATDGTFYLVRPDRHVAARWKQIVPDEVRRAFMQSLGR